MAVSSQATDQAPATEHYLKRELDALIQRDPRMWDFLQAGSLDGVWYWDLERPDQEWMSPEMWRLFGVDPATKRHDPSEWQHLIFKEDLAVALENFQKHCADPNHPYDQIVRYWHADGSTVWVRCRGIAIRDGEGKPIRMLGAHNDMTAVKTAELEARRQHANAEAAAQELRSFAYSVSHDIKAPTSTLKLVFDELRAMQSGDPEIDELLEIGSKTVTRMRTIVDDVLDYTSMLGQPLNMVAVDLDALIDELIKINANDIQLSGAQIKVTKLPTIHGVETQLFSLFSNLLTNALKFRREGETPRIEIQQKTAGHGNVAIEFSDNGIGIPHKQRSRVFEMFQRLHSRDQFPGTGLGLAICRRICLNHNGSIEILERPEPGTAFRIALPCMQT